MPLEFHSPPPPPRPKLIAERSFDVNPPNFVKMTSLLFPPVMLIFRRVLWCANNVEKIIVCCFVPFRRQWRGHYLKTRNKLNQIPGKNTKIWPKKLRPRWQTSFWCWKSETAKEKRNTRFFACLAEMSKTFILQFYCEWSFSTVAYYYVTWAEGSQGELIVYQWSVVCLSSSVAVHTFKPEYPWSQLVNLNQILCIASLMWGKGCIRVWGRLDQNSGFHGKRKPP